MAKQDKVRYAFFKQRWFNLHRAILFTQCTITLSGKLLNNDVKLAAPLSDEVWRILLFSI